MTTVSVPVHVLLVQVPVSVLTVSVLALSVQVLLSSVPVPETSVRMSILQELISIAARVPINQSCYTTVTVGIDIYDIYRPIAADIECHYVGYIWIFISVKYTNP